MKAKITITTDSGVVYAGEVELSTSAGISKAQKAARRGTPMQASLAGEIDFDIPVRPFIKKYSQFMTGPKRLTLLVARLADGNTEAQVQRMEIRKQWNKMTALMSGSFNPAYITRAIYSGWIDCPKPGSYVLRPTWREIFSK